MDTAFRPLPEANPETGLLVLRDLVQRRSLLSVLEIMHREVGEAFRITLPRFNPAVLVGAEWNRTLLVDEREKLNWRIESDPVVGLLRHGILVEDGEAHDRLRRLMEPGLRRSDVNKHVKAMVAYTDTITGRWGNQDEVDMLVEMRKIALLILFGALFNINVVHDLDKIWKPILRAIRYISPGWWIVLPQLPRIGFSRDFEVLDHYLLATIRERRRNPGHNGDWLTGLIEAGLGDDLIRDQMLTMLIAGHDTSTALLAWTLFLLGSHPESMAQARAEVDGIIGEGAIQKEDLASLHYLDQVLKETLRLYPPIHVGNRLSNTAIQAHGHIIPRKTRIMYSIYLSHRDEAVWPEAASYKPERFDKSSRPAQPSFAYVPFGGGPRNCIGAAFAQVESKAILARILQQFDLELVQKKVGLHMGATLEPRPGVTMIVKRRESNHG